MNETIIECSKLQRSYISAAERLEVLKSVDCTIYRGQTVSIMGPSGCGKSTLLSIIGGLDRLNSGSLTVDGWALHNEQEDGLSEFRASKVGFVFQFHYLLKDFSALENVMLPAYMRGRNRKDALDEAEKLLAQVGLQNRLHHIPAKLSGGERQRVAIARAMINRPPILLADEPTGNLDETSAATVEQLLFSLAEDYGTTLLVVTHDAGMASRAQRRFRMHDGEIFEQ